MTALGPACSVDGPVDEACPPMCRGSADAGAAMDAGPSPDGGVSGPPSVGSDGGASRVDGSDQTSIDAGQAAFRNENDAVGACSNGGDDDGDDLLDCADEDCAAEPYCCVGQTSAACCEPLTERAAQAFTGCSDADAASCVDPSGLFGSPSPIIEGGALVPNGESSDSGYAFAEVVDPTAGRVTLTAELAAPSAFCEGCLDAVAFGLADLPGDSTARVDADVAVMLRGSRGDVALLVAGEVIDTLELSAGATQTYVLTLTPEGEVSLGVGEAVLEASFTPRPARHPVIYGRTANRPDGADAARVLEVSVQSGGCPIPSALTREPHPLPWPGRDPAAAIVGDELLLAFERHGAIHLTTEGSQGWELADGQLDAPVLEPADGQRLAHPELALGDDRVVLYATRQRADVFDIVRAEGGAGFAQTFGAPERVEVPEELAGRLRAPAVVEHAGATLMAATAGPSPGRIVLLRSDDGGRSFRHAGADLASTVLAAPSDDLFHFAHDEVADPALVVDGAGLLRLYYAGRRGTRWAIGLRVSEDAERWRDPAGAAPIFRGSGEGHDALSVRAPSPVRRADGWQLFYTAGDGVTESLGRAHGSER